MNRNDFIKKTITGAVVIVSSLPVYAGQDRPPALNDEKVKEFVRNGHFDLPGIKQMLEQTPTLLNAAWDWGGGDFETALGGAAHMGNKEIAQYLIAAGARMDIFCAAMLGKLDVLELLLKSFPTMINSKGPHGITLLMHAQKGEAQNVIDYLKNQGVHK